MSPGKKKIAFSCLVATAASLFMAAAMVSARPSGSDSEQLGAGWEWAVGQARLWDGFGDAPARLEKAPAGGPGTLWARMDGGGCVVRVPEGRNMLSGWRQVFRGDVAKWALLHELAHCADALKGRPGEASSGASGDGVVLAREVYADAMSMAWLWMADPEFGAGVRRAVRMNSDSMHGVPGAAWCVLDGGSVCEQ